MLWAVLVASLGLAGSVDLCDVLGWWRDYWQLFGEGAIGVWEYWTGDDDFAIRGRGVAKAVGGALEIVGGVVLLPVYGLSVIPMAYGIDVLDTGIRQAWTGDVHETVTYLWLEIWVGPKWAARIDTAVSIASGLWGLYNGLRNLPRLFAGGLNVAEEVVTTPAGRRFTVHGLDQARIRGIPSSVIDDTIANYPGRPVRGGKTVHYSPDNNLTVVTGDGGRIVTWDS